MKRKQFEVMKNDLRVELSKLTIDSGNLNNDIQEAKLDFEMMCKSMGDRQAELLSSALFLEEKYGGSIAVLEGRVVDGEGEGSGENVLLPRSYEDSIKRFVEDSADSLHNHKALREIDLRDMANTFEKYNAIWKKNMKELRDRSDGIERQRAILDVKLTDFNQFVISDDGEDEEEAEVEEEDDSEEEEEGSD